MYRSGHSKIFSKSVIGPRRSVRRCLVAALIWPVVLSAGGCASVLVPQEEILASNARYDELRERVEPQVGDLRTAPTSKLFYLCTAYGKLKDYRRLFPCVDQLEANIARGDVDAGMVDQSPAPFLMRAEADLELANYEEAAAQAEKAFSIAKQSYHKFARRQVAALTYLGLAQALSNDKASALKTAHRLEAEYQPEWFDRERFAGIAKINIAAGDFAKALAIMQRDSSWKAGFVMGLTQALGGGAPFAFMDLPEDFIQAKAQFETGHVREAAQSYEKLLANPAVSSIGDIYWPILFDLGRFAEAEGRRADAIARYREAVEVIERQRSTINTMASKIGFVGDKQSVYGRLVAALVASGQTGEAFEYVERAKSRALVDMLAARTEFATDEVNQAQVRAILTELQAIEFSSASEDAGASLAVGQQRSARASQLKRDLQGLAPELATLVTVRAQTLKDIQAALPSDSTLIEYYYDTQRDLYAFVLTRTDVSVTRLDGSNLRELVERLRGSFQDPRRQDHQTWSTTAYARLLGPFAANVKTQRLVIVPHGVLHYLPFNTLANDQGAVIDRWTVRYLPSASVLGYSASVRVVGQAPLLALGNPDLGRADLALKYAQQEAEEVGRLYSGSTVLIGRQATKSEFVKVAPAFRYLHLATHGQFNSQVPLQSAVFLAGRSLTDGELTVGEIYGLRLNAELVTLSACETGLGKVNEGDDVVGLTQSFLYAGARTVVASLWPVDDAATLYLMVEFYRRLKTEAPDDALRSAQLATRQRYPHPVFWSAFQLTGAGRWAGL